MCGINVIIHDNNEDEIAIPDWLKRRGPDSVQCVTLTAATKSNITQRITLQSSVLNMRRELVQQPVCIQQDVYLAWNGEAYQTMGDETDTMFEACASEPSDTNLVADMMRQCIQEQESETQDTDLATAIVATLARLFNAAYALVVVTPDAIYYARDAFGRRSLLLAEIDADSSEPSWQLSSVSTGATRIWKEVEPGKLHVYQVESQSTSSVDIVPSISLLTAPINYQPLTCMTDASMQLEQRLLQAVRRRVSSHNAVSVLFSGGLDSAVLAAMVLQVLEPKQQSTLTLVNVCFVDDDVESHTAIVAADTLAARASYHDLQQRFPRHVIHLLESRVSWTEIQQHTPHIQQLAYPKSCSVMDLNIGTALWFAGRACPNRLIISGLGADELMGGYGRHRKAYMQGGAARLRMELDLDVERIWERNLGRDDRVLSDTAHEARFPFLDPHVVCYLKEIPLDLVCDYGLPPGQGDKRILRLVAERLGLPAASIAVKRAIQFGSRMSHVSDKHRYGSRRLATRTDTCSSAR